MKSTLTALLALSAVPALANDITATNCELFVDKIQVTQGSHALTTAHLFIKVVPSRLDGAITQAGMYHRRDEYRSDRAGESFDYRFDSLPSFLGSSDYFEYTSVTGHDWMTARELVSFVVETDKGTRYWLNQGNNIGVNFGINGGMVEQLYRRPDGSYREDGVTRAFGWDMSLVPQTADYPNDLAGLFNPRRCR